MKNRFSFELVLAVTCKKKNTNQTKKTDFYTSSLQWLVHCLHVCVLELILSTLEKEAWMHKARGQSHSRTSPAIQVTCFPDAGSFPLPRVAFHLVSVIHLSFSRWDRDSCVADTLPLCFLIIYLFIFYFVAAFLPSSPCCFTVVYPCLSAFLLPLF